MCLTCGNLATRPRHFMQDSPSAIQAAITLFVIFILPFFISYRIATKRNRSKSKSMFLTLVFGWFATIGLWLALKTRTAEGRFV